MNNAADRKCPACGRFVSKPDGFYGASPAATPDEIDPHSIDLYCDAKCYEAKFPNENSAPAVEYESEAENG